MTVKLVVTDLDGTLWRERSELHPAVRAALRELDAAHVPVLFATGRRRTSALAVTRSHGLDLGGVLVDGALGYESLGDEAFHREPLSAAQVLGLLEVFASYGQQPFFETDDLVEDFLRGDRPSMPPEWLAAGGGVACDLAAPLPHEVFSAVAILDRAVASSLLAEVQAKGLGRGWGDRNADFPDTTMVKVRPPGCTKWSTVVRYCELRGIQPSDVVAVGDDDNDVELLANAGVGLAVSGASARALAAADHVIPAPEDGGWARVLDYL